MGALGFAAIAGGLLYPTLFRSHCCVLGGRCFTNLKQIWAAADKYAERHGHWPVAPGPNPRPHESLQLLSESSDGALLGPEYFDCLAGDAVKAEVGPDGRIVLEKESVDYAWLAEMVPYRPQEPVRLAACTNHTHSVFVLFTNGRVQVMTVSDVPASWVLPQGLVR